MTRVIVRYKVKPDRVAENEQLVRDVYAELARTQPDGLRYATFKLPDGVCFVHLAVHGQDNPLQQSRSIRALPGRNPRPLRRAARRHPLEEVGSYRLRWRRRRERRRHEG